MRIWIDGIIRDMTPEEEARYWESARGLPPVPETETHNAKAEAYDILMGVSE